MTLKEFLEKNPATVEEAAKCKTLEEFKAFAEEKGLTFSSSEAWKEALTFVKGQDEGELSDDALGSVSGGKSNGGNLPDHNATIYTEDQIFKNKNGNYVVVDNKK